MVQYKKLVAYRLPIVKYKQEICKEGRGEGGKKKKKENMLKGDLSPFQIPLPNQTVNGWFMPHFSLIVHRESMVWPPPPHRAHLHAGTHGLTAVCLTRYEVARCDGNVDLHQRRISPVDTNRTMVHCEAGVIYQTFVWCDPMPMNKNLQKWIHYAVLFSYYHYT